MGFTSPWGQHRYMGEHATDAAALTFIQSLKLDSAGDGTGTAVTGQTYHDTTLDVDKTYDGTAWRPMFHADGSITATGDFSMGTNKITGLGDPTSDQDAATKSYVDALVTGLKIQKPVLVGNMIDDSLSTPPGSPNLGDAYVVGSTPTGGWSSYSHGDIVVCTNATGPVWGLVLAGGTAEPADEARVIVTGYGSGTAAGSFAGEGNNIGEYDTDTNTWNFTTSEDGFFVLIVGENEPYENTGWVFDTGTGWVQFSGATPAHNSLTGLQGGTSGEYYHLTATQESDLTGGGNASGQHIHDDRYYTETELGSTTASSEGASLIGTDTKSRLNSATDVETALTEIQTAFPKRLAAAGLNPNGVTTPTLIGDIYISSTSPYLRWIATGLTNTDWEII